MLVPQRPKIDPRPRFPYQFWKMATVIGHPTDWNALIHTVKTRKCLPIQWLHYNIETDWCLPSIPPVAYPNHCNEYSCISKYKLLFGIEGVSERTVDVEANCIKDKKASVDCAHLRGSHPSLVLHLWLQQWPRLSRHMQHRIRKVSDEEDSNLEPLFALFILVEQILLLILFLIFHASHFKNL